MEGHLQSHHVTQRIFQAQRPLRSSSTLQENELLYRIDWARKTVLHILHDRLVGGGTVVNRTTPTAKMDPFF